MQLIDFINGLNVSQAIADNDMMYRKDAHQHYFYVGKSDLLVILNSINIRLGWPEGDKPIRDILDFGCGHGRVTRWLRAAFPSAHIYVTDFSKNGVDFCVENFDCTQAEEIDSGSNYDLIWLGSVFTHLNKTAAERLLRALLKCLRNNGIIVFTSQGRYSFMRTSTIDWTSNTRAFLRYFLDQPSYERLIADYTETGYGYVNYPNTPDYGVSIVRPEWYSNIALESNEYVQILLLEKGADNHQDVLAFLRADLLDVQKGPLW